MPQLHFDPPQGRTPFHQNVASLTAELRGFRQFGAATVTTTTNAGDQHQPVPTFVNEFWTSKQRAASSLHEVSYRACFKPQLVRFFVDRLSRRGDIVYDPFMGRGTTVLESAMAGRGAFGCDVNPLSRVLTEPRLRPPRLEDVRARLAAIDLTAAVDLPAELLTFYHRDTLNEIVALRAYLSARARDGTLDALDAWIRMVATNRLTGHSPGFFSVYTLPPNQAVSVASQQKINERRQQQPPRRHVAELIVRKSRSLLRDCDDGMRARLASSAVDALLLTEEAARTPAIDDASVALVVTSPPFLDVVQYANDNWLRCWFCDIDVSAVDITVHRQLEQWRAAMARVFAELHRVLRPGGHVAFEVGEVRNGTVRLEEAVIEAARGSGLVSELVLINQQEFTKTANCWGIANNAKGTNSNRIVLLRKPG